jgi:hypothetical protein
MNILRQMALLLLLSGSARAASTQQSGTPQAVDQYGAIESAESCGSRSAFLSEGDQDSWGFRSVFLGKAISIPARSRSVIVWGRNGDRDQQESSMERGMAALDTRFPGSVSSKIGFEVSFWTSRDCFGPADPSNPWHLGNRVGNHSMWQAADLVETEGPAGNSVAVSATSQHPLKPANSAGFALA